jgi:ribonuclease D
VRIQGCEEVGLGALLEEAFDVHLEKRYQSANWSQRTLSFYLLAYTCMDTHYLIPLRNRLRTALLEAGKWSLTAEDLRRLAELTPNDKVTGAHLSGICLYVTDVPFRLYTLFPESSIGILALLNSA